MWLVELNPSISANCLIDVPSSFALLYASMMRFSVSVNCGLTGVDCGLLGVDCGLPWCGLWTNRCGLPFCPHFVNRFNTFKAVALKYSMHLME